MYVDGFVLPVPKKKLAAYKKMAIDSAKVWIKHGALSYVEGTADDVPMGKVTSFPQSVKLKKGEIVIFAWATYKNRKHRDQVMKKVMTDPLMAASGDPRSWPFDAKRMFFGGFETFVSK